MNAEVVAAAGYQVWAISGMVLFITAFVAISLIALLADRRDLDRMARLPLEQEPPHDRT